MYNVLIPTKLSTVAAKKLSDGGFNVVQDDQTALNDLIQKNTHTHILIVRSEKITAEIIDQLPELKLIIRAGAGYNTIDIKYARRKNIDVMNTPGANANAVAEEVVSLALASLRHLIPADISTREGKWEKNRFMGKELTGKTVGILGLGNIGRLVAKRITGFECNILGYDPALSSDMAQQLGIELTTVEEIFERSDIISLHIPENEKTKNMINENLLKKLKPNAILINCARSGIVNENDLRQCKSSQKFIYCTDVYPKDEAGHKSITDIADIMLPHLGASTIEANENAAIMAAEQTIAYFEKGITNCVVNKSIPDSLDPKYQDLASVLATTARQYLGTDLPPFQIEISLYGKLQPFFSWMISPITSGLFPEFDPFLDASDANTFLHQRGIAVINRKTDSNKHFDNSITIDLLQGNNPIHKVSIRGTLVENKLMISRINDFQNLYLEPAGHHLFAEYSDEPGIIGKVAGFLGSHDINILDIRAPQDLKINRSMAVIKMNKPINQSMISEISKLVKLEKIFCLSF